MAAANRLLGQFNLDGIPPAPRGIPQIEVAFDIDVNGILSVSAKDVASGKEQKVRIEESSGLSETEIEKMRKDAESHAEEDAKARKLAEARNTASSLVYSTEKLLKEHAEKVDASSKSAIEASIEKVKKAAEGSDPAAIDSAVNDLTQATHALSQHLYSSAGQAGGATGAEATSGDGKTGKPADEDVIDAEFEKAE